MSVFGSFRPEIGERRKEMPSKDRRERKEKKEKNQYKMKMLRDTLKHLRNTEDVAESRLCLELHETPRE